MTPEQPPQKAAPEDAQPPATPPAPTPPQDATEEKKPKNWKDIVNDSEDSKNADLPKADIDEGSKEELRNAGQNAMEALLGGSGNQDKVAKEEPSKADTPAQPTTEKTEDEKKQADADPMAALLGNKPSDKKESDDDADNS